MTRFLSTRRIHPVFHGSALTLVAVEAVESRHTKTSAGCRFYGRIEPVALLVRGSGGTYALDMEAQPIDVDKLVRDVPDLATYVTPGAGATGDQHEAG